MTFPFDVRNLNLSPDEAKEKISQFIELFRQNYQDFMIKLILIKKDDIYELYQGQIYPLWHNHEQINNEIWVYVNFILVSKIISCDEFLKLIDSLFIDSNESHFDNYLNNLSLVIEQIQNIKIETQNVRIASELNGHYNSNARYWNPYLLYPHYDIKLSCQRN